MHLQDADLSRALALEAEAIQRRRGPQGKTKVRPAARIGQPYDVLTLNFTPQILTRAVGVGTQYASSASLAITPAIPLGGYSLLWPDIVAMEVNNAALGGNFVSFLAITLDDASEFALNGTQMICTNPSGKASVNGPTFNDVAAIGPARSIVSARIRLQANGPGTATATAGVDSLDLYLFRSRLGRTIIMP
jgi:hypothetical protein